MGTFTCSCGFVFSRRGPDINPEDKYKVGIIKQYGHEWEEKLKELILRQDMSLRAISRILKCDSKTIVKYGRKMGLENYISSSVILPLNTCPKRVKRDYKKEFEANVMQLIRCNPTCDKKIIKTQLPKEFSWLVKYDLDWLNKNVPVQCNYSREKGNSKVNWHEVDVQTLSVLQKAYSEIMAYEYPQRVTKTLLGRISGRLYYLKNKINLLPQSQAFMNKAFETTEQYKKRTCKTIIGGYDYN